MAFAPLMFRNPAYAAGLADGDNASQLHLQVCRWHGHCARQVASGAANVVLGPFHCGGPPIDCRARKREVSLSTDSRPPHLNLLAPGVFVRHPTQPDWGLGQVQSVIGERVTVNFENRGKVLINGARVTLEVVED